ncbi:IS1595 family transposase [Amycolatopsis palatopharyngis]|uniref:IS1595 family transposase n=1 Tax=Amycolatopsis palatopharyngis TaxID=187982 RepID=UPI003CCC4FEC
MAGVDYPGTYQELLSWFPDNQACIDYLASLRWPQGFSCPACGGSECWRTRAGLWMCRSCNRKTSVTAGTIFDRTRTPLSTWFAAIWFVTTQRNGVSARNLQQILGFASYETAWAWLHKIRRAMVRPDRDRLSGIVEVDEAFLGGVNHDVFGGYGDKVPVSIAVERLSGNTLGRIRLQMLERAGYNDIVEFVERCVEPGSLLRTDGHGAYLRLPALGYDHRIVALTGRNPASAATELPGVHRIASLLKRWLLGTYHLGYSPAHLPYYLDEFTFRFNRRKSRRPGMLFYRLLQQAIATDPHPLHELTTHEPDKTDFT